MPNPDYWSFTKGKQPCKTYLPHQDGNEYGTWNNVHECYRRCGKTVSFCLSCNRDHHEDGYETCTPTPGEGETNKGGSDEATD